MERTQVHSGKRQFVLSLFFIRFFKSFFTLALSRGSYFLFAVRVWNMSISRTQASPFFFFFLVGSIQSGRDRFSRLFVGCSKWLRGYSRAVVWLGTFCRVKNCCESSVHSYTFWKCRSGVRAWEKVGWHFQLRLLLGKFGR